MSKSPGIAHIRKCNHAQVVAMQCMLSPSQETNPGCLATSLQICCVTDSTASLARFLYPRSLAMVSCIKRAVGERPKREEENGPVNIDQTLYTRSPSIIIIPHTDFVYIHSILIF